MANSNSKLKKVNDHVKVDGETFIIVSVNGNRALLTCPDGAKRFTLSTSELAGKEVFIKGLHSEQQAAGGELSLEDELKPIIGRLPIQCWFKSNGDMTYKAQDDIYDALRRAGYDSISARKKAQNVRAEHNAGSFQYQKVFLVREQAA